jgi:hypothetical protein
MSMRGHVVFWETALYIGVRYVDFGKLPFTSVCAMWILEAGILIVILYDCT